MEEQFKIRCAEDKVKYANMTPKQRQAKKDQYKARRKLRRNTLYKDSIAMVNPFYDSMDDSS